MFFTLTDTVMDVFSHEFQMLTSSLGDKDLGGLASGSKVIFLVRNRSRLWCLDVMKVKVRILQSGWAPRLLGPGDLTFGGSRLLCDEALNETASESRGICLVQDRSRLLCPGVMVKNCLFSSEK